MKKYIISDQTIALKKNENQTEIIEVENSMVINKNILNILDDSCKFYGSSLKGRLEGSKYILDKKYKLPILMKEDLFFFPLTSYRADDLIIINIKWIKNLAKNKGKIQIEFFNNIMLTIECGENKVKSSILTCLMFMNEINMRKYVK